MRALILLSLFAVAFSNECALENQHYEECGTACPLTCDNYKNPPKFCVLSCNIGCHCDAGYVKTADGHCVRPEECPAKSADSEQCPENEHYESCGTACPLTCENVNDPPSGCILMCNRGCHCDEGYVRHSSGSCVKAVECGTQAAEFTEVCDDVNAQYESCGTSCPLTCDNFQNPPKICNFMCNAGCHCKKGFVKNAYGSCVKPEECPAKAVCGENQHHDTCGTACPLTCDNYNDPPAACVLMCNPGCHCNKGYVKTGDGRCVEPKECPAKSVCGENQRFSDCGSACPLTCDNMNNPPKICPAMCVTGCECEKGFVKTTGGACVRPENCPSSTDVGVCDMPAETGVCRGFFPRFYFDRTTGQCKKFVYGGCGGNENNFESEDACHEICSARSLPRACEHSHEVGLCRGYFPRYYFNGQTCEKFIYGGCGGNENNFETEADCMALCGAKSLPAACNSEKVVGPCRAYVPRYFYNSETNKCEKFIYGGCKGNENNFDSMAMCEQYCVKP